MEIRIYRSNAELPDLWRGQILALIRIGFCEIAGDYRGPAALPDDWHPAHVIGTEGDVLLSYAGVVWGHIEHQGEVFKTYGLSSVYTFPFYRRTGLGSRIVRHATRAIEQAGDGDLGLLFTMAELEAFYRRAGWQAMPGLTCLIGDPARPKIHRDWPMMMFLSAKGQRHRAAFDHCRVYVGAHPW